MDSNSFDRIDELKRMFESDGVPAVDPADLLRVWKHIHEISARYPNQQIAIDIRGLQKDCDPGVNLDAVWIRVSLISLLASPQLHLLDPWMHDGEPDPVVLRVMAEVPIEAGFRNLHDETPFGKVVVKIKKAAEGRDVN